MLNRCSHFFILFIFVLVTRKVAKMLILSFVPKSDAQCPRLTLSSPKACYLILYKDQCDR